MSVSHAECYPLLAVIPGPGLLFGLVLLAAIVGGYSARFVHLPRVIGFLLGGIVLHALLIKLLVPGPHAPEALALEAAAQPLSAIKDLALGLILFTIGGVFLKSKLRAAGPRVAKISLLDVTLSAVFVFVGCGLAAVFSQPAQGLGQNLILAALLGAAAIATAPAATLFVLQEYEAKGSITETILGLTGVNNVVCIVAFHTLFLVLVSVGALQTAAGQGGQLWIALPLTIIGSAVLGVVFGTMISIIHARLPLSETMLIFFALFILLGAGEHWLLAHKGLSYNSLLTALVMGGVFANVAIDPERLETSIRTVGSPIFAGFFVLAGYDLHLGELSRMGWVGLAYVVCRMAGKILGGRWGVRWAGAPQRAEGRLGSALLCQAAVVIGLAAFVQNQWHNPVLAKQFATVLLGSVVLFELVGPLLVKRCVVQGGEVKAITMLRRASSSVEEDSIIRLTLESLLRLVGLGRRSRPQVQQELQVKDIMRTNVQFLPAAATFDEVLHLIERSTHSHFPVIEDDGTFVGVIHFSDIRDVMYDPSMRTLVTAVDLADPDSTLVPLEMPLKSLLAEFTSHNVAVLPVCEAEELRRVVGIVEQRDLLGALHASDRSS